MKTVSEVNIFEENKTHCMHIETRNVIFDNSEIDASQVDLSNAEVMDYTMDQIKSMGVLSDFTC